MLVEGFRAFYWDDYPAQAALYRSLAEFGQTPRTMIIGCCDSRVDPSRIFSARPGELFVVRNVANLVPPCEPLGNHHGTSAALEFAVTVLHVDNIVIFASGAEGLSFRLDFVCLPSILLVSVVPGILMLKMIRQGAPIAPVTTTALAALAAGALGATALRLFHAQDASMMVLVWQFGSVALLAGLGALIGRQLLPWPAPRITSS
ncbi:MAG: NrsF family protein [Hyphomicrobiaceae bacterium]